MENKFRKSPPVCLFISLVRLLTGKLRFSKQYSGCSAKMEDGSEYKIFRHITANNVINNASATVFIVSFKFARLSHNANRVASIIPMLLITGFPGFQTKMYAVNKENGFWQGMYQWKTQEHLQVYLRSFVYKMMNKRALKGTISSREYNNQLLISYIEKNQNTGI